MNKAKLDNFERAFSANTSGCRRGCHCGKEYYDTYNSYDWENGELEALHNDPNAVGMAHAIGDLRFEGKEFVDSCNCWHERAKMIIGFIDGHAHQIARYLTLEKMRKQQEADNSPTVKEPS